MMGNPLYEDDVGAMCYNIPKSWQTDWYDSQKLTIHPKEQDTWSGTIVGIANLQSNPQNYPALIKIETGTGIDQFLGFNRAAGVNRHNKEANNEVTITEASGEGESPSQSFLKAHLTEGEEFLYSNWADTGEDLIVKAITIYTDDSSAGDNASEPGYGYATIQVCLGECKSVDASSPTKTAAPTSVPTPPPTTFPTSKPTNSPTQAPMGTDNNSCVDSATKFVVTKPNGSRRRKSCYWLNQKWTTHRCQKFEGAEENCPLSCNNCCRDVDEDFELENGKIRRCSWAAKDPATRCAKAPTKLNCPITCENPTCM